MIKNEIIRVLKSIKPDIDWSNDELNSISLTGDKIKMIAPELVYLVLELQKSFKIKFESEDFENYKFNTVNSIVNIVEERVRIHEEK